jgi:predicted ribonuclease YlaK
MPHILIHDPQSIFSFADNTGSLIPISVISEIDRFKKEHDPTAATTPARLGRVA